MAIIESANLALRFLLELCALIALGYWGFQTARRSIAKIGLGIGALLLAALVWSTFVAPGSPVTVPELVRLLLELAIFGLAIAALYSARHLVLA